MPQILGYFIQNGMAHAIKSGRSHTNPLTDWFFGIPHADTDFNTSDDGLAKAYLASLWAYRCISLRGKKVAEVPLFVKTHDDEFVDRSGRPTSDLPTIRARQHILQAFLGTGREKMRRLIEYDLCIWGRCFIEPTQRGLMRLNPSTVIIDKDTRNGIERFRQVIGGSTVATWGPDELIYIYDFDPADDLGGLSPLAFALQSIGSEVNIDQFVSAFFKNDATPAGLLTTEALITPEQVSEIQGWWQKLFSGISNKFKVGVVGNGLKFEQITSDMANLAIPDLRLEVRREVCAAFGVPMTIAGADEAANYSCCPAGELVATKDGQLPIEDVVAGDIVATWANGSSNFKRVEAVIKQPLPVPVYRLTTRWHSLRASNNHRVLCPDTRCLNGYRWRRMDELSVGDWVITCDEPDHFRAETIRFLDYLGCHEVWDLCIADDHTFIAGGIVVHNTSNEQHQALYTETIIPEVEMIVSELNRQLLPHFDHTGTLKIVADFSGIEVLQRSKVDLSARYTGLFTSGVYSLNETRRAEGMPPNDVDYYLVPNVGLIVDKDLPKLAARNIAPPPDAGGFGGGLASVDVDGPHSPPPIHPPELPAPKAVPVVPLPHAHAGLYPSSPRQSTVQPMRSVGQPAYVAVPLYGNATIRQAAQASRRALGDDAIDWQPDERWHCTLVACDGVPDSSLGQIGKEIELREPVPLVPDGVGVLDGGDAPSLVLFLRKDPSLVELQRHVYSLFADRDLPMSPYSKPARYRPHVTLGTVKPGYDVVDVPDLPSEPCMGESVSVSRPEYRVVCEVQIPGTNGTKSGLTAPRAAWPEAVADLKRFENKLLLKGIKARFADSAIPAPVMFFLRSDIDNGDGSAGSIKAAVANAVHTLQQTPPEDLADFLTYWKDIDEHAQGLVDTLGDILSNPELLKELAGQIEQTGNPDTAVNAFMDGVTDAQVEQLVGTEDAPGPLVAIMLAGIGRGQELLDKLIVSNAPPAPMRHAATKAGDIPERTDAAVDVTFRLLHTQARDWARTYAYELVKGINATTANTFRQTFSDWITRGGSLPGLVDVLHGRLQGLDIPKGWDDKKLKWATSRDRARVVAQTEATRAFSRANINTWASKGYPNHTWRTQRDRDVCPFCEDMNGVVGSSAKGYPVPSQWVSKYGAFVAMPAHPGDRCFPSPVASSRQFPMDVVAAPIRPERQTSDSIAIGGAAAVVD